MSYIPLKKKQKKPSKVENNLRYRGVPSWNKLTGWLSQGTTVLLLIGFNNHPYRRSALFSVTSAVSKNGHKILFIPMEVYLWEVRCGDAK